MDALSFIINSFALKKLNYKSWIVNFIFGMVFLCFAIFIIVQAKNISLLVIRFIGVFLIIDALLDFFTVLRFNKEKKEISHSIVEARIEE